MPTCLWSGFPRIRHTIIILVRIPWAIRAHGDSLPGAPLSLKCSGPRSMNLDDVRGLDAVHGPTRRLTVPTRARYLIGGTPIGKAHKHESSIQRYIDDEQRYATGRYQVGDVAMVARGGSHPAAYDDRCWRNCSRDRRGRTDSAVGAGRPAPGPLPDRGRHRGPARRRGERRGDRLAPDPRLARRPHPASPCSVPPPACARPTGSGGVLSDRHRWHAVRDDLVRQAARGWGS